MGIILDVLTLPVLGAPRMVGWIGQKVAEAADNESMDDGAVRGQLLELRQRYDAGEIPDEEYDRRERALLEQLNAIREAREERSRRP